MRVLVCAFKAWRRGNAEARPIDGTRRFVSGAIQVRTTDQLRPLVEIPWTAMLDPSAGSNDTADQLKTFSKPRH
jgi:hypothetical protein